MTFWRTTDGLDRRVSILLVAQGSIMPPPRPPPITPSSSIPPRSAAEQLMRDGRTGRRRESAAEIWRLSAVNRLSGNTMNIDDWRRAGGWWAPGGAGRSASPGPAGRLRARRDQAGPAGPAGASRSQAGRPRVLGSYSLSCIPIS